MSSQVEMLLAYQEEDAKLINLDVELSGSDERKKYMQAKNFLSKAQERLDQLEVKAAEVRALIPSLQEKYEELNDMLNDYEHVDELIEQGADVSFYKKNASNLAADARALKTEINAVYESIKKVDAEYRQLRKDVIPMQTAFAELQKKYQEAKEAKLKEGLPIQEKLKEMAEGIDDDLMKLYREKRSERIFPVLAAVKSDRCSKCGCELSIKGKEKLSSGAVVECENCHRILYKQ